MRFQCEACVNALQRLERRARELLTARGHLAATVASEIDSIIRELEIQITGNDDLGSFSGSEEELVFRTSRMIIDSQLNRIGEAIRSMADARCSEPNEVGDWTRFLDAIALAQGELRRTTEVWHPRRPASMRKASPAECATYHAAINSALLQLRRLDEIPDVERLLYRGVASRHHMEIARACEQVLMVTRLRIDMRTARRSWSARVRWEQVSGPISEEGLQPNEAK